MQHQLDTSSDELEEKLQKKKLRFSSTTPKRETGRAWARHNGHNYDNVKGNGPVSSPAEKDTNSEKTESKNKIGC